MRQSLLRTNPASTVRGLWLTALSKPRTDILPDTLAPALYRRVESRLKHSGTHALLHSLTDRPVLPIDQVPEPHRIRRVEIRPGHLGRVEEEIAHNRCVLRTVRPEGEGRNVVRRQTEHAVRIEELALVAG